LSIGLVGNYFFSDGKGLFGGFTEEIELSIGQVGNARNYLREK